MFCILDNTRKKLFNESLYSEKKSIRNFLFLKQVKTKIEVKEFGILFFWKTTYYIFEKSVSHVCEKKVKVF